MTELPFPACLTIQFYGFYSYDYVDNPATQCGKQNIDGSTEHTVRKNIMKNIATAATTTTKTTTTISKTTTATVVSGGVN